MAFKDVLTWLEQPGLSDLSSVMALLRVQDAHDIMEFTTEAAPSAAASMIVRRDITPVTHTKRGNLQSAILASYDANRKRSHDQLTDDFYAPSRQDSRQSVWKTWCTIAQAWDLLPLPIADELVLAVGASLTHGGYRSSKNYFSRSQREHRDHSREPLPERTLALIAKVTRSINRGIGPTQLKDSFELELFSHSVTRGREGPRLLVPAH